MCFYKDPNQLVHNVAEQDTICYKVYWRDMREPSVFHPLFCHCGMKYKVGDTVEPNVLIKVSELDEAPSLTKGVIHSYTSEKINKDFAGKRVDNDLVIAKCIIPAGTAYWKNKSGEYASTKIIIQEIIH